MSDTTRADLQAALDQAVASVQHPAQLLAWLREREERGEPFDRSPGAYSQSDAELTTYLNKDAEGSAFYVAIYNGLGGLIAYQMTKDGPGASMTARVPNWALQLFNEVLYRRSRRPATRAELVALVEQIAAEHAEAAR